MPSSQPRNAAPTPAAGRKATAAARASTMTTLRTLRTSVSLRLGDQLGVAGAGLGARRGHGRSGDSVRRVAPVGRLGREPVANPEVRVDVAPARRGPLELLAELAHEDVDRAVAVSHRVAPDALVDLLALEHLPGGLREQPDQLELAAGEVEGRAPDEGLVLVRPDLHLAHDERGGVRPRLGAAPPAHDGL